MVSIDTYNACVDFPIFDAKSRSQKKAMLSTAGGAIGKNAHNTVVAESMRTVSYPARAAWMAAALPAGPAPMMAMWTRLSRGVLIGDPPVGRRLLAGRRDPQTRVVKRH